MLVIALATTQVHHTDWSVHHTGWSVHHTGWSYYKEEEFAIFLYWKFLVNIAQLKLLSVSFDVFLYVYCFFLFIFMENYKYNNIVLK